MWITSGSYVGHIQIVLWVSGSTGVTHALSTLPLKYGKATDMFCCLNFGCYKSYYHYKLEVIAIYVLQVEQATQSY